MNPILIPLLLFVGCGNQVEITTESCEDTYLNKQTITDLTTIEEVDHFIVEAEEFCKEK